MKPFNWHTLGWVIIVVLFIAWEAIGLANRSDPYQPFTFFVRKILGSWTNPVWWLGLGFMLWMLVHFLFVKD